MEDVLGTYEQHPALITIGYDNEVGNGFMSHSEVDRLRFVAWLKARNGTTPRR